jgi:regulator of sigma D
MPQAQTQPAKHPKFTALLVDYISEHKDKIIERWIKAVQAESEI